VFIYITAENIFHHILTHFNTLTHTITEYDSLLSSSDAHTGNIIVTLCLINNTSQINKL